MKIKRDFLHSIGYLNCTNNHISIDLLLIPAHARLPNYLNYKPVALLLSKIKLLNAVKKVYERFGKNHFGQSKIHVRL